MIWIVIAIMLLAVLAFLSYASANIRSGVYLKVLSGRETTERVVALTFDDGPDPEQTPKVLDVLKRHGVKACFFCIGEKAEKHPELIQRMFDEGHLIGNHSYRHKWSFPLQSQHKVDSELADCDQALHKVTGETPSLFRPPFGVTNPIIARAVGKRGYTTIGWNIRSLDTRYYKRPEKVLHRIRRRLRPGSIILLHDRLPGSDRLLEELLQLLHDEQYSSYEIRFERKWKILAKRNDAN